MADGSLLVKYCRDFERWFLDRVSVRSSQQFSHAYCDASDLFFDRWAQLRVGMTTVSRGALFVSPL